MTRPRTLARGVSTCLAVAVLSVGLSACNSRSVTPQGQPLGPSVAGGLPVVEFGPGVSGQFRRARSPFAARPMLTQEEYISRNAAPKGVSGPASLPGASADPEVIAAFFADRTILTYSAQHGTQIEYISPSGDTFLWYPGNDAILRGSFAVLWENGSAEIDDPREGRYRGQVKINNVCFRYGANTYNPVTGHRGAGFECGSYARQRETVRETRKGDVFGLATRGAAPFPLGREAQTIAALDKRARASR